MRKYKKPQLIELDYKNASGECISGSVPSGGNNECTTGDGASNNCTTGVDVRNADCTAGTNAGNCIDGTNAINII